MERKRFFENSMENLCELSMMINAIVKVVFVASLVGNTHQ